MAESDGEVYEIDRFLDRRWRGRHYEYLIRWRGFGSEEDQWVRENDIHAKDMIGDYNRSRAKTPRKSRKKKSNSPRTIALMTDMDDAVVVSDEEDGLESSPMVRPSVKSRSVGTILTENIGSVDSAHSQQNDDYLSFLRSLKSPNPDSLDVPTRSKPVSPSKSPKSSRKTAKHSPKQGTNWTDWSMSVYDVPLIILLSCLLFLIASLIVEKQKERRRGWLFG